MTTHDSRELLIHRLERAPGRQGGRKVLVARDDGSADEATVIGAIESGAHGPGRFLSTWRSNGRIVYSLTAACPPEPRVPPRPRSSKTAAKGDPTETALCHSPEHAQEIAALRTACADATARLAAVEQTNASLRDAAAQAHQRNQDDEQRRRAVMDGMHRLVEQMQADLKFTRDACLELERCLHAAQSNLTRANGELSTQRSTAAGLYSDLERARAAGPDIGAVLLAAGVGVAVGALGAHLLATEATPPVLVPAPDISGDAAPSVDHE